MVGRGLRISGLSVTLVIALSLAALAGGASASSIVYQCGGTSVCAVDPDTDAPPSQLSADGRVAGITRDGSTAAWVASNPVRIVEAPFSGGPEATLFTGEVYDYPQISPDGSQASWTWFFSGYGWYTYVYSGPPPPPPAGQYPPAVASSTYQTTAGWLGEEPIVSLRGNAEGTVKAQICKAVNGGPNCDTLLASDPDSQLSFPDGSPDGQSVVATRGPIPSSFGTPVVGTVALYSTETHAKIRDLMPGQSQDTHPVFSADGQRVAFERDGGIWVVGTSGGTPRRVATGTTPFWGGPKTEPDDPGDPGDPDDPSGPDDSGGPGAHHPPVLKLKLLGKPRIGNLNRSGLRVRISGTLTGRALIRLTVSRAVARRVGLGKRLVLAQRRTRIKAQSGSTVRLKPAGPVARKIGRAGSFRATVRAVVKTAQGSPLTRSKSLVFKP